MKPSEYDGKRVLHIDGAGHQHSGVIVGQSDDEQSVYVQSDHPRLKPAPWDFSVAMSLVPVLVRNAETLK